MTIDRDGRDEGQARLEWMKDEFQHARQRWLVKADVSTVESQPKAAALSGERRGLIRDSASHDS